MDDSATDLVELLEDVAADLDWLIAHEWSDDERARKVAEIKAKVMQAADEAMMLEFRA